MSDLADNVGDLMRGLVDRAGPDEQGRIAALIREQMKHDGRPVTAYLALDAQRRLDTVHSIRLTNEILRNFEDRLCQLEAETGGES